MGPGLRRDADSYQIIGTRPLMVSRSTVLSLAAAPVAAPSLVGAQTAPQKIVLYANVGADLTRYEVDVDGASLTARETVTMPGAVQYAWPHASRRYLYVATSNN